jgi:hypothetical protein
MWCMSRSPKRLSLKNFITISIRVNRKARRLERGGGGWKIGNKAQGAISGTSFCDNATASKITAPISIAMQHGALNYVRHVTEHLKNKYLPPCGKNCEKMVLKDSSSTRPVGHSCERQ